MYKKSLFNARQKLSGQNLAYKPAAEPLIARNFKVRQEHTGRPFYTEFFAGACSTVTPAIAGSLEIEELPIELVLVYVFLTCFQFLL